MIIHPTFIDFMESAVLPLRGQLRLDGATSGGNRSPFGWFRYRGAVWRVHADSRLEPLLLAHSAEVAGSEAFTIGQARTGRTLELKQSLQSQRNTHFKHLYIYEHTEPEHIIAPLDAPARAPFANLRCSHEPR